VPRRQHTPQSSVHVNGCMSPGHMTRNNPAVLLAAGCHDGNTNSPLLCNVLNAQPDHTACTHANSRIPQHLLQLHHPSPPTAACQLRRHPVKLFSQRLPLSSSVPANAACLAGAALRQVSQCCCLLRAAQEAAWVAVVGLQRQETNTAIRRAMSIGAKAGSQAAVLRYCSQVT
jgi:hypothetical protein